MRATRNTLVIAVMAVSIAALAYALVYFARDEFNQGAKRADDDIPASSAVTLDKGYAVVRVSAESQLASGIVVAGLETVRSAEYAEVYGTVLNLQPLLELRGRYRIAVAEAEGLRAASANSRADYLRLKQLFADERNVSERALQSAESQWQSDSARFAATELNAASLLDQLRVVWGPVLAGWAGAVHSRELEALATQRQALIQMSFPDELQALAGHASLAVAPIGSPRAQRLNQRTARFLCAAAQADSLLSGATYLYLAEGGGLRSGMRLAGKLQLEGAPLKGNIIPASAIVWHGGKAWAYVKEDPDRFVRKPVPTNQEMGKGWFTATGFSSADRVVVSGAQLLLSEELKFQIRNENED
jgi:hypothetical protein